MAIAWRWVAVVVLMAGVGLGSGCRTSAVREFPIAHSVPELTMVLMPGDELEIVFFGAANLNTTQTIRRDGRIAMQLVGEVEAAGKTPLELKDELTKLYEPQLQVKEVTVILRSPPPVFVTGAVTKPGPVALGHATTALEAIVRAGGFDVQYAEVRDVVVIRHDGGRRYGFVLDFQRALAGYDDEKDRPFYLKPFDIVYVPQTRIAKIDRWVDQHISKMIPVLGVRYDVGNNFSVYR